MRRTLAALVALTTLLALAACDPEDTGNNHKPKPKPAAGGAAPQHDNGGGEAAQPAPVQGDPNAHNTQPGEVDVHVSWTSENKFPPVCEWSKNAPGVGHPCENMANAHKVGKDYVGLWEYETTGAVGDVFFVAAQGTGAMKSMECSVAWKGQYHAIAGDGKRCSGTYVLE